MKAVVLAGGRGTRLLPLTVYRPKPMIPFFNRPLMEYALLNLASSDIYVFEQRDFDIILKTKKSDFSREVGRNVKIERSVILSGVTIGEGTEIREAIIGENVRVGKGVVIQPGSVVGDNTLIEDFSKIGSNVKIWVESRIGKESIILPD